MFAVVLAGAGLSAACDAGKFRVDPATQPADPLVMLGANVGTNLPMPSNGAIQLSFNRYLLPSSAVRQSVAVTAVGGGNVPPAVITYDPVARLVTLQNPSPGSPWLLEGQSYRVDLKVPTAAEPGGLRALDGATLEKPGMVQFIVGPAGRVAWSEPKVNLCTDILPIFAAKCEGSGCHGSGQKAAASLILTSSLGLKVTAVGRVAQAANTGGRASTLTPGRVFGINMPLVDPGNPGNSWLLYKTLLVPPPKDPPASIGYTCTRATALPAATYVPLAPYSEAPTDLEAAVLQDYVPGREMPFPVAKPSAYEELPLTFAERERLRLWIAQGADVPECGGCGVGTPPGGLPAPADAGRD